ncbi:hypothetical protein PanWU01x14_144660, partial [Parasponia andersonii]
TSTKTDPLSRSRWGGGERREERGNQNAKYMSGDGSKAPKSAIYIQPCSSSFFQSRFLLCIL